MSTNDLSPSGADPAAELFKRAAELPELDGYRALAMVLGQLEISDKAEEFKAFRERIAAANLHPLDRAEIYQLFQRPLPAEVRPAGEGTSSGPPPAPESGTNAAAPPSPPRPFSSSFVGKSIFGTKPAGEGGPRDYYVGWGRTGVWQQRGPLTRTGAVRMAADLKLQGFAPYFYAPQLGDQWHPVGKLFPTE